VVGLGPGGPQDRTRRAEEAIAASSVIIGYSRYLDLIADLTGGKEVIASGMMREVERCRTALDRASRGDTVSLVSSGDPGIYGMAGLVIELAATLENPPPIEIVPGVSSANAAAARLGAPLMLDYAVISLSDLLVPWETICERLECVAAADLVVALYNPRSKKRRTQIEDAAAIMGKHRPCTTPVGIATAVGTDDETIIVTDLEHFLAYDINMRTVIIIGNRSSKDVLGRFITPRGYRV
jgi:precorrin-3B C17-methyltransferase